METPVSRARSKSPLLVLLTSLLIVLSGIALPSAAQAAPEQGTVEGATLDWGVKQSFRNYLTGPIAHGSITMLGSATQVGGTKGGFSWPGGSGEAATNGSSADVGFGAGNGVHFRGHEMTVDGQTADALDMRFTNPRILVTSTTTAELYLDVRSRKFEGMTSISDEFFDQTNVHFADVALSQPTTNGTTFTWTGAATTLTEAGSEAFGGFYGAGDALDPLNFTVPVAATPDPEATTTTLSVAPEGDIEEGTEVSLTATVAPAAVGTVAFRNGENALGEPVTVENGTATLKTSDLPVGDHSITAVFTPADAAAHLGSTSDPATVSVKKTADPDPVWEPKIEVFREDGTTPVGDTKLSEGDKVVVKGSGFDPEGNIAPAGGRPPISAGSPAGTYVVFGNFAENWQPSGGNGERNIGSQRWVLSEDALNQVDPRYQGTIRGQWVELSEEGEFTWEATLEEPEKLAENGHYGIYTYGAGGVKNADQELGVRLNYKAAGSEPEPVWEPKIEVFAEDGVTPIGDADLEKGDKLVVRGSGFDPEANVGGRGVPIPNTLPQGTYVTFGHFAENWKPSDEVASSQRKIGSQGWVLTKDTVDKIPANYQQIVKNQWVPLSNEGTFTWNVTLESPETLVKDGRFGIYTFPGGGVKNADQELAALLGDYTASPDVTKQPSAKTVKAGESVSFEATGKGVPAPSVQWQSKTGNADWADIKGATTTKLDLADVSADKDGTQYRAVFTNEHGTVETNAATLTVESLPEQPSDPTIGIEKSGSAVQQVKPGDKLTIEISDLKPQEKVFVEAHSDPVAIGSPVANAQGVATASWTVPANFPAGSHNIVVFAANGDVKGDELGRQPFAVADAAPVGECRQVTSESLTWGVKQSFRNYVGGPIAHGKISLLGRTTQADSGAFVWTKGAGKSALDGSAADIAYGTGNGARFTGHQMGSDYALDLQFTNPRVVVTSATTARLHVDVAGRDFKDMTSVGERFETKDVHFADLALSAPATSGAKRTWTNAAATLTADGERAFGGFYEAGTELDPVSFDVTTGAQIDCDDVQGPGGGSGETPAGGGSGGSGDNGNGGTTPGTGPGVGQQGDQCVAREVTGGSLEWGLKASFREYVGGRIAKGQFSGGSFSATGGAVNPAANGIGKVNYSGAITATGHGGLLNFKLSNPTVQITGPGSGVLHAHVSSTNTKGETVVNGEVAFANLSFSGGAVNGDTISVSGASATLTGAGATAFAGFYDAGTALDAVSFTASLGGEVPCDGSTDPGQLPKTGAEANAGLLALSAFAVLAGAAILARRRQLVQQGC
ncbi:HtaA domain-containing protein [Aeromicrobium sp. YIM 150415]|uniref:HtaA domain-containing protein n=1 Tax=Aeromicrobium sp. YIM 150415 TaxID=2803912 RepID=UPI0019655BA5|nr:HtaA domain-containing protein [Aeromicrobium sp. YIM 150415]MBM9465121.1 HtaA domain-containing protein [Aeromicrobium sp. YIM 150415]